MWGWLVLVGWLLPVLAGASVAASRWLKWVACLEGRRAEQSKRSAEARKKPSTKRLSIIIPAFNEEKRLPGVLQQTLKYLASRRDREGSSFTYEVIVVDDGSRDQTAVKAWLCAKENGAEDAVKILLLDCNSGKGAAVRHGMLAAEGDLLLMMDADGATDLSHGLEALEAALCARCMSGAVSSSSKHPEQPQHPSRGAGGPGRSPIQDAGGYTRLGRKRLAAFGSRAHLEQEDIVTKRTRVRNFAMHGFHMLVFLVVGGQVRDTQCGFKLFTRAAAFEVFTQQRLERWCFDVEVIHVAQRLKIPLVEVQVKWCEIAGSKLKFLHVFHMALEILTVFVCYNLGLWRIRSANVP